MWGCFFICYYGIYLRNKGRFGAILEKKKFFLEIQKNDEQVFLEYLCAKNSDANKIYCSCLQQKQFVITLSDISDLYFPYKGYL